MARTPTPHPASKPDDNGNQVELLLDLAREQIPETLRVMELLESKARGILQAVTVYFAASQTAVGIQASRITDAPDWFLGVLGVLALVGLVVLMVLALKVVAIQSPVTQKTLDVAHLRDNLLSFAKRGDARVPGYLLGELATIVSSRRDVNEKKAGEFSTIQWFAGTVFAIATIALGFGTVAGLALT